jgi:hypothetical protein
LLSRSKSPPQKIEALFQVGQLFFSLFQHGGFFPLTKNSIWILNSAFALAELYL